VAVLCPIGLDHVQHLGSTVELVATEKAGIVKEGSIAVVREQPPEALRIIRARAADVGATVLLEDEDFGVTVRAPAIGGQAMSLRTAYGEHEDLFLPLFGENAARNAGAAVAALEAFLGRALDGHAIRRALRGASSPGRVEVATRRPLIVLDGAHNPDAATALVGTLREAFHWDRLLLVMAAFADKDVEEIGRILAPITDAAFVTRTQSPRAAPSERVAEALRQGGVDDVATFDSVSEALAAARGEAAEDDLILVTGSFYTVADARPLLAGA
jgi:dihydrofolate synthase/folylpolyglutamate synthase